MTVAGKDIDAHYRAVRSMIGLVPQELTTNAFEKVWDDVSFTRGLFGKPAKPELVERILKDLSLWEKRDAKIITLSGGMKRRHMIAKALAHEPQILFLDEPTAGVDVELRRDMWKLVRSMREAGVTIILTTHYIEEAEDLADRVGVIHKGELILVEDKAALMRKMGKKQLTARAAEPARDDPRGARRPSLELADGGRELVFTYDTKGERTGITQLLGDLGKPASAFATCRPARARWKTFSSDWWGGAHEPSRGQGHLRLRDVADVAHAAAEHRLAGHLDLALFRRLRRGDRLAHHRGRGRQLRRLHRAGADHADAAHAEHLQRLLRHLFPEIHRHDLRGAVGAGLLFRDRPLLRRRSRDQIDRRSGSSSSSPRISS